jgi:hypothetical protein
VAITLEEEAARRGPYGSARPSSHHHGRGTRPRPATRDSQGRPPPTARCIRAARVGSPRGRCPPVGHLLWQGRDRGIWVVGSDPQGRAEDPGGPGSHQRDGCLIGGLGTEVRSTAGQVGHPQARTAVGASPRRQAALIGQELDRADMLGRIAVPAVALMVAVDRMPAGAVDRWARGHRHLTSGRQPGAGTGAASFTRVAAIVFLSAGFGTPQPSAELPLEEARRRAIEASWPSSLTSPARRPGF